MVILKIEKDHQRFRQIVKGASATICANFSPRAN
jgi:hypothetical protein